MKISNQKYTVGKDKIRKDEIWLSLNPPFHYDKIKFNILLQIIYNLYKVYREVKHPDPLAPTP